MFNNMVCSLHGGECAAVLSAPVQLAPWNVDTISKPGFEKTVGWRE